MKEITITVPDNCELKQDGNTYTVVEKEKKLTYEDVAKELFKGGQAYYVCSSGLVATAHCSLNSPVNCVSMVQAEKLLAINKLMNVAKYLNGDWQPDWHNGEDKYYISIEHINDELFIDFTGEFQESSIYFKSEELAQQAIGILGEETIKLALCTDY